MRRIPPSAGTGVKDANGAYVRPTPAAPVPVFSLTTFLFDKQLKFVEDPHSFKTAVCSRRSGKTIACAADLIDTCLRNNDVAVLYITLSRNNAKKIIWREIKKINTDYKLGGSPDEVELSMTFPTGSVLYLSGAKDESEIEKFRGMAFKKVYIDECQSFREYIRELIDDVLAPALMDYNGSLCLIGTPGPLPSGFFAEVCGVVVGKESAASSWSHHYWTFFDNPYIVKKSGKTHQEMLNRELKRRGVTAEDPSIQREWFGKWVLDSDALWIRYDASKNHYTTLPEGEFNYIMGIDLGFDDADAIAILGWSEKTDKTFLVEELVVAKQGITELVEAVNRLNQKYKVTKMVIDQGGLGKKIAEEMRRRHSIPVQPADKTRKQENVAFLNDALRTGKFMAKSSSRFAQDSYLVEIDWGKSTPDKIALSKSYHSDIIDAVLYSYRESPAYAIQVKAAPPKPGTKEYADAQADEMWEAAQTHFSEIAALERRLDGNFD